MYDIELPVCLSQNDVIKDPERLICVAEDSKFITYGVLYWQKDMTLQDGRFSKMSQFSNIWCFFKRFFAQNKSNVLVEWLFRILSLTFDPK